MKKVILASILGMFMTVYAKEDLGMLKEKIESKFRNTKIISVDKSEIEGLYEVILDMGRIIYVDKEGKYILVGHILDESGRDITGEKIQRESGRILKERLNNIDESKLLKIGSKGIKRKVIEITDPECPYCRKAEEFFKDEERLIIFMPLPFHKNARDLSIHILCSKDAGEEYKRVFSGKVDGKGLLRCKEGEERLSYMESLANELQVQGTPTFIVIDGDNPIRIEGLDPVIKQYIGE